MWHWVETVPVLCATVFFISTDRKHWNSCSNSAQVMFCLLWLFCSICWGQVLSLVWPQLSPKGDGVMEFLWLLAFALSEELTNALSGSDCHIFAEWMDSPPSWGRVFTFIIRSRVGRFPYLYFTTCTEGRSAGLQGIATKHSRERATLLPSNILIRFSVWWKYCVLRPNPGWI